MCGGEEREGGERGLCQAGPETKTNNSSNEDGLTARHTVYTHTDTHTQTTTHTHTLMYAHI